mgnify:CR=1 FL=1|tara:strand:- start:31018 stop:31833 length:816 start_codon:yes stop_codon:yes gene_type:complete
MRRIRNAIPQIPAKHWLLSLLMASAACSPAASPAPTGATSHATASPRETTPADAGSPHDAASPTREAAPAAVRSDAGMVPNESSLETEATKEAFRDFRKPPKLIISPPTKTSALTKGKSCRHVSSAVYEHERRRLVAALDAKMRRAGGLVLPLRSYMNFNLSSHQMGHTFRGPQGEHLMILGTHDQCGSPPTYVLTANKEVFLAYPTAAGKKKNRVMACAGGCGGCGMQMPDIPVIAEVPKGSRLGPMQQIKVPIDTEVVFTTKGMCIPRP